MVHVFTSTGRFRSIEDLRFFLDEAYTEDGDGVPSPFMREVGMTEVEPGCIEAFHGEAPIALSRLLAGASYGDQWIPHVDPACIADSAVCVFEPNRVLHPGRSSLDYIGAYSYVPSP